RASAPAGTRVISLGLDTTLKALRDEGYRLEVTPARVTIRALRPAGAFYAIQTLRQLLPPAILREAKVTGTAWRMPAVSIEDYPPNDSQQDVASAQARFVTIVPEIEIPGHSQAASAAYPELGNTGDTLSPWTSSGVDENILNPGEPTIRFYQNVLTEVMALFPGRWIHIGGDEAPKAQWKASSLAQQRIRELGLKDEDELQSWFTRRMDEFLTA